jgi:hypothetical protein
VDELLGCHFHLVREDMLGPVRAEHKKCVANTQPMKTLHNVRVTWVHRDKGGDVIRASQGPHLPQDE